MAEEVRVGTPQNSGRPPTAVGVAPPQVEIGAEKEAGEEVGSEKQSDVDRWHEAPFQQVGPRTEEPDEDDHLDSEVHLTRWHVRKCTLAPYLKQLLPGS